MKFIKLMLSNQRGKRFAIIFEDPKKTIHFGSDVGTTYIDEGNKTKRRNYIKRHIVREDWTTVNAGSLSRFILWGQTTSLADNLKNYLERFNIDV
jgi:Family of unknown function (DUF5754)